MHSAAGTENTARGDCQCVRSVRRTHEGVVADQCEQNKKTLASSRTRHPDVLPTSRMPSLTVTAAALALSLAAGSVSAASVLKTSQIRLGSGSVNSVNAITGNVEQPFYYQRERWDRWRKLTYSAYGLDSLIKINGVTKTISGSVSGSGPIYSSATKATVTQSLGNGHTLTRQYSISGSVFTTNYTVCAPGWAAMQQLQVWVGTRDDYIGSTDQPTKELGSFSSSGSFVKATSQSSASSGPCRSTCPPDTSQLPLQQKCGFVLPWTHHVVAVPPRAQ